jgi:2-polyprenyl-3-methyl-5-hydroxy-6-metoxy-1,4-benzoquinol methylase
MKLVLLVSLVLTARSVFGSFNTDEVKKYQKAYCAAQMICPEVSEQQQADLIKEAAHYTKSRKFLEKIKQAEFPSEIKGDRRYKAVLDFLAAHVLLPHQSVIDLGCAAGAFLRQVKSLLNNLGGHGNMTGIELTPGWIEAAKRIQPEHDFYVGDVTTPHPSVQDTYDVILLNDVMEHIMRGRYGCLFETLRKYSHPGTTVYMHVPTVATQINEKGQYFENTIPQHSLISGMACAGFEVEIFEYDMALDCGSSRSKAPPPAATYHKAGCRNVMSYPKYYNILFRRPFVEKVANLLTDF